MKNFALIGVAGYIAPRHLRAIADTGNCLVAATDPHDSVGILDSYFSDVDFFTEFERFDRHIDKLRRNHSEKKPDYVTICSPNYLHDAHIRFALRSGADAICEKPVVLNPWNLDGIQEIEMETGQNVYTILQLRLHPAIRALKERYALKTDKKHEIDLTYITSRGKWYQYSWKGVKEKSGGLTTNIGIHFFDMLQWIFGDVQHSEVHIKGDMRESGFLELENARVRWFLSIDPKDLPFHHVPGANATFRSITVDGEEIEFSGGFTDLHTVSYEKILAGEGFRASEARSSIQTVYTIRTAQVKTGSTVLHPLAEQFVHNG